MHCLAHTEKLLGGQIIKQGLHSTLSMYYMHLQWIAKLTDGNVCSDIEVHGQADLSTFIPCCATILATIVSLQRQEECR